MEGGGGVAHGRWRGAGHWRETFGQETAVPGHCSAEAPIRVSCSMSCAGDVGREEEDV